MGAQHFENLLRRYRGQGIIIKTRSGGIYEGTVTEITGDYVALVLKKAVDGNSEQVFVLFHSIEAMLPASADIS